MFVNVQQNTDDWFDLRLKKATSSNFAKIMANEGKAFGQPAIDYAQKVALEIATGERDATESFKNAYMDRGHELEPEAIQAYETESFLSVSNGGFYQNDEYRVGDSPDGNIGTKGCLEVKSVIPNTQWKRLKKGGIDSAYKWQIHGHIWIGEKEWCDFVSYCPEMSENKRLYIHRVERDEEMIERIKTRIKLFNQEVDNNLNYLK